MVPPALTVPGWHWAHWVTWVMATPTWSLAGCGAGGLAVKWQLPQAPAVVLVQLGVVLLPPARPPPWHQVAEQLPPA